MHKLSAAEGTPVIRTDFSDQGAWDKVCAAILAPDDDGELFTANVKFVDDAAFRDYTPEQILTQVTAEFTSSHPCLFVVDRTTVNSADWPVLVVDLWWEKGRTFRTIADELYNVASNLSIINMDFFEFADAADGNGIFRGFEGPSRAEIKAMLPQGMIKSVKISQSKKIRKTSP